MDEDTGRIAFLSNNKIVTQRRYCYRAHTIPFNTKHVGDLFAVDVEKHDDVTLCRQDRVVIQVVEI